METHARRALLPISHLYLPQVPLPQAVPQMFPQLWLTVFAQLDYTILNATARPITVTVVSLLPPLRPLPLPLLKALLLSLARQRNPLQ